MERSDQQPLSKQDRRVFISCVTLLTVTFALLVCGILFKENRAFANFVSVQFVMVSIGLVSFLMCRPLKPAALSSTENDNERDNQE